MYEERSWGTGRMLRICIEDKILILFIINLMILRLEYEVILS